MIRGTASVRTIVFSSVVACVGNGSIGVIKQIFTELRLLKGIKMSIKLLTRLGRMNIVIYMCVSRMPICSMSSPFRK